MQGHFEVERCTIDLMEGMSSYSDQTDGDNEDSSSSEDEEDGYGTRKDFKTGESLKEDEFDIVVISRRSRHRAGMAFIISFSILISMDREFSKLQTC